MLNISNTSKNTSSPIIRGNWSPQNKVTAEVGTQYVDLDNTNWARIWVSLGNKSRKVIEGNTGLRVLESKTSKGNSKIYVQRINNLVFISFGGGNWGLYDINRAEAPLSDRVSSTGTKMAWIKATPKNRHGADDIIPNGFRSSTSMLTGLYTDAGEVMGSIYIWGTGDSNCIQFRLANKTVKDLTDAYVSMLRTGIIVYNTDQDWPSTLP